MNWRNKMRFLIVGDLHGQKPDIHFKNFDAIIVPGDVCITDELRRYAFEAMRKSKNKKELKWYEICGKEKAKKIIRKALKSGRKILEFLNSFNVPVYIVPGNTDFALKKEEKWNYLKKDYYHNYLLKNLKNIFEIESKIKNFEGVSLIGYGLSFGPEYPQYKKDIQKLTKKELEKEKIDYNKKLRKISEMFKRQEKPIIFLSHNVPFNTKLDKITWKESPRFGDHLGSLVTRKIIDKYQPLICIGGHIHEHFKFCKLGKTVCINAGFGPKVNTLLEIKNTKITKLEFYPKKYG